MADLNGFKLGKAVYFLNVCRRVVVYGTIGVPRSMVVRVPGMVRRGQSVTIVASGLLLLVRAEAQSTGRGAEGSLSHSHGKDRGDDACAGFSNSHHIDGLYAPESTRASML